MSNFYPIGNAALVKERVVSAGPCRVMGLLGSNVGAACIVQVFDRAQARALTTTGDTHSNTTLDNLAAATVAKLKFGAAVAGSGIPAGTTIVGFPNTTSVTLSAAATETASGVTITFDGISDGDVPMFEVTASAGTPTEPANWTFLPPSPVDLDACTVKASSTQGALTLLTTNRVSVQAILAMLLALLALVWPAGAQVGGSVGSPVTASSAWRLILRGTNTLLPVVNVMDYGATGDGVTDDTAAIQAAINASTNLNTPGDITLPAGRYKITSPLQIWPNDPTQQLHPYRGPIRLLGAGSASSVIVSYVTNGAAIDVRSTNSAIVGWTMERLGLVGPLAWDFTLLSNAVGVVAGWNDDVSYDQYRGINLTIKDCAIDGFASAVAATNVWGFGIRDSTFNSNRLHAIAFSKVHSAQIERNMIRGVDVAGRLTGTGIGFYAPREDVGVAGAGDSSWGFGDTATLICNNILFATNGVFNNELHLYAEGENYQFCHTFWTILSGQRTNIVAGVTNRQMWAPWARLSGTICCDSAIGYRNGGQVAQNIMDSKVAPRVILENTMMDVCISARRRWDIWGVNQTVLGPTGNDGYFSYGSTNWQQPMLIAEANELGWHNSTNSITIYAQQRGNAVTNLQIGATLEQAYFQSMYPRSGAALTISNGGNPYVPQLLVLEGGQGTAREAAIGLGGDYDRAGYSASYPHVGSIHGYTVANPYYTVPDVQLLSYSAFSNRVWLGIGATPGYIPAAKGVQQVRFHTAPGTNQTAVLRGGIGTNGGWSFGAAVSDTLTNGQAAGVFVGDGALVTNTISQRSGSAAYQLTSNAERFFSWGGGVNSSAESFAGAPMAVGGAFAKLWVDVQSAPAAGTNYQFKLYTNGVFCGVTCTLTGNGTTHAASDLVNTTAAVPAGTLVSVGVTSTYNGTHPTVYFKWSWVVTN